jgi:tetratricopeptide (TPR) repeat protein
VRKSLLCLMIMSTPFAAGLARADVLAVGGTGFAADCFHAAQSGRADNGALTLCTTALASDPLPRRDVAATRINRAVIFLHQKAWRDALTDLDVAIRLDDSLAEAHVNRGAALLGLKQWAPSAEASSRGLALRPNEPEKALFNRAIAREALGDTTGAYADYLKASELAPNWTAPKFELKRFTVSPR